MPPSQSGPMTASANSGLKADCVHCAALRCLLCTETQEKVSLASAMHAEQLRGALSSRPDCQACPVVDIPVPGRPARPQLVPPRAVASRGLGTPAGRVALVHAVAHIEFNAINLACDAVYRFRGLPAEYYADWVAIAADEARHFQMLQSRLVDLGASYGDLDAHDGLWQMAVATAHDPLARMALVPRVLEARGLDVTPGMIERLRSAGDLATVACLEIILEEEVAHVAAGTRWFRYLCAQRAVDPEATFFALADAIAPGALRGPFNLPKRKAAGFSAGELETLGMRPGAGPRIASAGEAG